MSAIPLPIATDFTKIDFTQTNPQTITNDPRYTQQADGSYYLAANSTNNQTGIWAVGGQSVTAGQIVLAKFWRGYLSANATMGTHLSAMNTNTQFAKAAANFSSAVKTDAQSMDHSGTKTYANLISLATQYAATVGVTPEQFVALVLPNELGTATYGQSDYTALTTKIDQYSSSKLTDNSVLQQKYDIASSNRNTIVEAASGLAKAWNTFLLTLAKGI